MNFDLISTKILAYLQANAYDLVAEISLNSPRSIGDAVQEIIAEQAMPAALKEFGVSVDHSFGRRSMEDLAFEINGNYYAFDVKTHNLATSFNMPNLISAKRLAKFYENSDKNFFCIILISYEIIADKIAYTGCFIKPIEQFNWECLTIGALGWGQIQLRNANDLQFCNIGRKAWMLQLCDRIDTFYTEEIGKIGIRKNVFSQIRAYWESK